MKEVIAEKVNTGMPRRHDLDALRAFAMLLGIMLHSALAYVTFRYWPVYDTQQSPLFDLLVGQIHGFRMHLFMVISGFFTAMLWRKRGLWRLTLQRLKRIGLPLLIGYFLFAFSFGSFIRMSQRIELALGPERPWLIVKSNDRLALKTLIDQAEDKHAFVNQRDPEHQVPMLNWAALNGAEQTARLLIESGADIDSRSGDASTPLMHAGLMGQPVLVELLLKAGANPALRNNHQASVYEALQAERPVVNWVSGALTLNVPDDLEAGRRQVKTVLDQHIKAADASLTLWQAAQANKSDVIQRLLEKQPELIDLPDEKYRIPALGWAAMHGALEAAQVLLDHGAKVNAVDATGSTSILQASLMGRTEMVQHLLTHKGDPAIRNHFGMNASQVLDLPWPKVKEIADFCGVSLDEDQLNKNRLRIRKILQGENEDVSLAELTTLDQVGNQARQTSMSFRGALDALLAIKNDLVRWPGFHGRQLKHLWFLWFLCLLMIPFFLYCCLINMLERAFDFKGLPRWLFKMPVIYLWIVPVTFIPQWLQGDFGPDTSSGFFPLPQALLLYWVYFLFGALYFDSHDGLANRPVSKEQEQGSKEINQPVNPLAKDPPSLLWWLGLPIAIVIIYPLAHVIKVNPAAHPMLESALKSMFPNHSPRPLLTLLSCFYSWMMIFGLMGLFRVICYKERKWIRYLSDSSYWLYLAHLPLMFLVQVTVKYLPVALWVKFTLSWVITTAILLVCYELFIRYTFAGGILNGPRRRPRPLISIFSSVRGSEKT